MRELNTAKALRAILRIEHPDDSDVFCEDEDEEETNPQAQVARFVETLLQPAGERRTLIESSIQERKISGVFLRDGISMKENGSISKK